MGTVAFERRFNRVPTVRGSFKSKLIVEDMKWSPVFHSLKCSSTVSITEFSN